MRAESFAVVGIDPGALAGVVAIRFVARELPGAGRRLVPTVQGAQIVESVHVLQDPTSPAIELARVALLMAAAHDAELVGIEIPPLVGPGRNRRIVTYGAQRQMIGVTIGRIIAQGYQVLSVSPAQAKVALADDSLASKRGMMNALKSITGWERCWDTAQSRLEAKADAVGIALAAGKLWRETKELAMQGGSHV